MDRWVGKVAVVTGASAGIGAAIVEALVREGLQVVGIARREQRLIALAEKLKGAKGKLYARQADVRKEGDLVSVFDWVKKELGGIDVLVNNAGVGGTGVITDGSTEDFRKILDVNVLAVAICAREAARSMKERGVDGHIFNINSIAGHYIVAGEFGLYPSSKFAVTALTEVVRKELVKANTKIKITSISPGLVDTEIFDASGFSAEVKEAILKSSPVLNPEDVANALLYVLGTPPHVQISELTIRPTGESF